MEPVWQALQNSGVAQAIRDSTFIYPIANVAHVVAVIAFFGAVAAMDLRLLNVLKGESAEAAVRRLRPAAIALLVVVAAAGFVLFAAEAVPLAGNPAFQLKLVVIVLALANVVAATMGSAVRITAALSLLLWLAVATLGRSIAYV